MTPHSKQFLDDQVYKEVVDMLGLFDSALRSNAVHESFDQEHRNSSSCWYTEPNYGTRPKGSAISKLAKTLVFGTGSADQQWSALKNGSIDESRFPRALGNLIRFLSQNRIGLAFDSSFSTRIYNNSPDIGKQIDSAVAQFGALFDFADREKLVEELSQARPSHLALFEIREFEESELWTIIVEAGKLPVVKLNDQLKKSHYKTTQYQHGMGLWSPLVNSLFIEKGSSWSPRVIEQFNRFQAPDRRIGWKKLVDGQRLGFEAFNQNKMGLRTDILVEDGLPGEIVLQECDYVDNLSTNDIATARVYSQSVAVGGSVGPKVKICSGSELFLDYDGQILPANETRCSNQIGASTLAFTNDGVPLLIHQLPKNLQSKNLTAPSGSGSFDYPSDYASLKNGLAFGPWLIETAQRELREELGLDINEFTSESNKAWLRSLSINTMFVGFGSLLHRGAKPDFFFLGRIMATLDDLISHHSYSKVEKVLSARLYDIKGRTIPELTVTSLQIFCENERVVGRETNSVPLAMLYDMIIHAVETHPKLIDDFLLPME